MQHMGLVQWGSRASGVSFGLWTCGVYLQMYPLRYLTADGKMDSFLETYRPPKLNQEETDQRNILISGNEMEYVIKTFPTNKKSRTR